MVILRKSRIVYLDPCFIMFTRVCGGTGAFGPDPDPDPEEVGRDGDLERGAAAVVPVAALRFITGAAGNPDIAIA